MDHSDTYHRGKDLETCLENTETVHTDDTGGRVRIGGFLFCKNPLYNRLTISYTRMYAETCTLYIPTKLSNKESTVQLVEKLSQALKHLNLNLRTVTTENEPKIVLVTPFGVFENGEIDVLIRQLSSLT